MASLLKRWLPGTHHGAVRAEHGGDPGQVTQVSHGRVEAEDLKDEQVNGGDGVERAMPPRVADLTAGVEDLLVWQERPRIVLDSPQCT